MSIDALLSLLRRAAVAVAPIVREGGIPWDEKNSWDDWDTITDALYRAIIVSPIKYTYEGVKLYPFPNYGSQCSDYSLQSYLSFVGGENEWAFVGLEAKLEAPFATAQFVRIASVGALQCGTTTSKALRDFHACAVIRTEDRTSIVTEATTED